MRNAEICARTNIIDVARRTRICLFGKPWERPMSTSGRLSVNMMIRMSTVICGLPPQTLTLVGLSIIVTLGKLVGERQPRARRRCCPSYELSLSRFLSLPLEEMVLPACIGNTVLMSCICVFFFCFFSGLFCN